MTGIPLALAIERLCLGFLRVGAGGEILRVVDGIDVAVGEGEIVGMVGESGSGKSLTALAALGLVPAPGRVVARRIEVAGVDVQAASERELERLRGRLVGYVPQEPLSALNPVRRVGGQVAESALVHGLVSRAAAPALAARLLAEVGLEDGEQIARAYPHQLSGGQRQRVLIAAALAAGPQLLIADEPTSALDTVAQRQFVAQLGRLHAERGLAMLIISHDLPLVLGLVERVTVVYAGETVECAPAAALAAAALHPYTRALLAARPRRGQEQISISGTVPRPGDWPEGCRFAPRCPHAEAKCRAARPALVDGGGGRQVRCFLVADTREAPTE